MCPCLTKISAIICVPKVQVTEQDTHILEAFLSFSCHLDVTATPLPHLKYVRTKEMNATVNTPLS